MRIGVRALLYNDHLRQARIDSGFKTIASFSLYSNINANTISELERMKRSPRFEMALKLSELLDRDVEYLFPALSKKIARNIKKSIYLTKEMVSLPRSVDPISLVYNKELKENINETLSFLDDRERRVIELRFGLNNESPTTLAEVGRILNVSQERIRQVESKAIRKLRHPERSKILKEVIDV